MRAALGAGWGRIVRVFLVESALLGVIGGALGVGLAEAGLRVLVSTAPANLPRLGEIAIGPAALGFAFAISLVSSLLFGLIPALKYGRPRISQGLRGGGRLASDSRERHRARNVLVVAQITLALVLLVNSGLMIRTFQNLRTVEPGFVPADLQTARISIPASLVAEPEEVARLQQSLVDELRTIPGVTAVGFASMLPMEGFPPNWDAISVEGQTFAGAIPPLRLWKSVSPGLFETTGTRLVAGRDFAWADLYDRRPVVIVSENLARELWGGASSALGKRVRTIDGVPWRDVIGVVQDVRDNGVQEPAPATVYWPSFVDSVYRAGTTTVARTVTFAVRSRQAGTEDLLNQVRHAVKSVNASLPLASVRTMQERYDQSMARTSFALVMLAIAGAMALALGIVGILRRDRLRGLAADPRDRDPAGAGRPTGRAEADVRPARPSACERRPRRRVGGIGWSDARHVNDALRRQPARSGDVRLGGAGAGARRHPGQLPACAQHGRRGSGGGAQRK